MIYEIKNLNFRYPNTKRLILDNVSLTLKEGEIMSILGPNGAGKSTLLNCMCNMIEPSEGEVILCGKDLKDMKTKEIAGLISYVPQSNSPAFAYTVFNYTLMGRAPKIGMFERPKQEDIDATQEVIKRFGIEYLSERAYTEISGGERQQSTVARAVVQEPKVILFDEPTNHLDFGNQLKTLKIIKELSQKGYAVVITTHNPDHAILLGGTAAIIDRQGHLEYGKSEEILSLIHI